MKAGRAGADMPVSGSSSRRSWRLAIGLAFFALICGVLLVGVSVWFLGAVALAGGTAAALTFNFHHPAALIRFLAIARTGGKYGERLAGHRAALQDQVDRRRKLFRAMASAPDVRRAGWQLAREDRLTDYIDDVEDLDYRKLRVDLPAVTLIAAAAALFLMTLWLYPLAALVAALSGLALSLMLRRIAPSIDRYADTMRMGRRCAASRLGATLCAFTPLTAEGERGARVEWSIAPLGVAIDAEQSQSRALSLIDNAFSCAGLLVGLSVVLAAWFAGLRGTDLLPAGFLAFAWIALSDHANAISKICLGHVRAGAAQTQLGAYPAAAGDDAGAVASVGNSVSELSIADLPLSTPDGRRLGGRISADARAGRPMIISGPSGCGKTTLLKTIAGWLEAAGSSGEILVDGAIADKAERRALVHLGLHDAAVLHDTIRENLFASGASDADLWEALNAVELADRVRHAGGLESWVAQINLSLGEAHRLALARAWLSNLPVIALDEPEAHLDRDQAIRILDRLEERFADRVLIYTSHSELLDKKRRDLMISVAP